MSKENRPEKNGNCWNCDTDLGYPLIRCCSGRECGCMGWPTEYPFCNLECHMDWQQKREEVKRLDVLKPIEIGDDLPF
jgi:hypothetical protein